MSLEVNLLTTKSSAERLIVFARYPSPGFAKTRLIPTLGAERAAQLQRRLTEHTLKIGMEFQARRKAFVDVRFTGCSPVEMQDSFGHEWFSYLPQCDGDLGDKLHHATVEAFASGATKVVVIGTDCPDLGPEFLEQAFRALNRCDVVLGPAADGGYTLIGMKAPCRELFLNIDWGTDRVLAQTRRACSNLKYAVQQLVTLSDIDYPEDLLVCRRLSPIFDDILPTAILPTASNTRLISIVIPTLNEAQRLKATLAPLLGLENIEIIVVDGGSSDGTIEIAKQLSVRVISSSKGRGRQMNAGAALASGEVILFLHADTQLPTEFVDHVWQVLNQGSIAGAFRLRIGGQSIGKRIVEWGTQLRSRWRQLPYGDQAIFVRASDFYRMQGYRNLPLMEDYEFCQRFRRQGRIALANAEVQTSDRRWKKLGILRTTFRNQCCILAYHCGIPIGRIAMYYYHGSWFYASQPKGVVQ